MTINPNDYDHIIVYFSGGKDSLACLLYLMEIGTDMSKVELWHHEIDGREGSTLMDWPVTPAYCQAVADEFNLPIYFSWKVGGFEREMLRENSLTAPTKFETPEGEVKQVGGTRGRPNTRRKFPQVSADLKVRWCSAYLKIDIAATAIRNQERFDNSKTLVISGERAEESPSRAKYLEFEPDRSDNRDGKKARHVDRWRPVKMWSEAEIWAIIKRWKVNPHPAYHLGWGRVSCLHCIFGSPNQCASARIVDPNGFIEIATRETEFDHTIHRDENIIERAVRGTPYPMSQLTIDWAMSTDWRGQIIVNYWKLPAGAFGESCGPS
jgi:3'-phosphoadenosine 5'-phosphosulfate sulfotransferase (PAPS reductase)/FAD synthetase